MKKALKIIGIIVLVLVVIALSVYFLYSVIRNSAIIPKKENGIVLKPM